MDIEVTVTPELGLDLGIEPGKHRVELEIEGLDEADRAILKKCLDVNHFDTGRTAINLPRNIYVDGTDASCGMVPIVPAALDAASIIAAAKEAVEEVERKRAVYAAKAEAVLAVDPASDEAEDISLSNLRWVFPDRIMAWRHAREEAVAQRKRKEIFAKAIEMLERVQNGENLDMRFYREPFDQEIEVLYRKAEQIVSERKAAAEAAMVAARDQWLRSHGGELTADKIAAGYRCGGEVLALVRKDVEERLEAAGIYLTFLDKAEESSSWKERFNPSDAAFEAEQSVKALGFAAEIKWGVFPARGREDEEGTPGREILVITVPLPWAPDQTHVIEASSVYFAD